MHKNKIPLLERFSIHFVLLQGEILKVHINAFLPHNKKGPRTNLYTMTKSIFSPGVRWAKFDLWFQYFAGPSEGLKTWGAGGMQ